MTVARQFSPPRPQKPPIPAKKEPSWVVVVLLCGIFCGMLLFTLGWYLSLPQSQKGQVFQKVMDVGQIIPGISGLNQPRVLLVMGVDMPPKGSAEAYKQVRTDTMMLVKLDPQSQKVNVISIPRDSKVYIAGNQGVNKINAALPLGGPDTAVTTVQQTLGVDVNNYLIINLRGVHEVVDAVGGIDIYVEKPMHYHDHTAHLNIDFQPGEHHLDGQQAEEYLRFRHDAYGDIGRIRRQQLFIAAFTAKLKDPSIILKLKPLIDASNKYVETNLSTQDLLSMALFAKGLNKSNYQTATLPGHPSSSSAVSYWIIDSKPAEDMVNRMIVGIDGAADGSGEAGTPAGAQTVGLLYTSGRAADIRAFKSELTTQGYQVTCQAPTRSTGTKLITHNAHISQDSERKLQAVDPLLKSAQFIFSPHGGTYEANSCGHTDFTVILGDDTRSSTRL